MPCAGNSIPHRTASSPLAEETGLIVPLVRWIIDGAGRAAALLRGTTSLQLLGRAFEYGSAECFRVDAQGGQYPDGYAVPLGEDAQQ